MSKTINTKILIRRDTSSNWSSNNPILASGEIGFDTTVGKHKIGDGIHHWNELSYFILETDLQSISYSTIVGNGTATTFTIVHNLNSKNLIIQCYDIDEVSGILENIIGYYQIIDNNTIKIDLSYAPITNGLKVTIMKC